MTSRTHKQPIEVWGGVECSFVHVQGRIVDQLVLSGHYDRPEDLEQFASLGIKAIRYPIIWERHHYEDYDWRWADRRLTRLRELGIRPIVGFVHHGSGPCGYDFTTNEFADGLAAFAGAVAARYPWIDAYTPINEPLTTARLSGLYGVWHPHQTDIASFARILVNECHATRLAMKAIRRVRPDALLIQTEDLGKTHSTPHLSYQADYENERRWLSFDLLCGKLGPSHSFWKRLTRTGISVPELQSFQSDPCQPDMLGINYYVTSERFLDERTENYPESCHGGNEREQYADVTAVRVREEGLVGAAQLLEEVYARYKIPIAITEVQLACTREEQLRWVIDFWKEAEAARSSGVDIRAFTFWSLLGAYDWNSLLARADGVYESGAFDSRSPVPRKTIIGQAAAALSATGRFDHPVLSSRGWWRRPIRFEHAPVSSTRTGGGQAVKQQEAVDRDARPILVIGADGRLGRAFTRICEIRGLPALSCSHQQMDITDPRLVADRLTQFKPWAIVNCSGFVRIDDAESERDACFEINTKGAVSLAAACREREIHLATFSSDQVFDGHKREPYLERDALAPLNAYGQSQREAELEISRTNPTALIVRSSSFFSPWDEENVVASTIREIRSGGIVRVPEDITVSPTYVPDLVNAALDLIVDAETGIWHLTNQGQVTLAGLAFRIADYLEISHDRIRPERARHILGPARRPSYCVLESEHGPMLPHWENALSRYFAAAGVDNYEYTEAER